MMPARCPSSSSSRPEKTSAEWLLTVYWRRFDDQKFTNCTLTQECNNTIITATSQTRPDVMTVTSAAYTECHTAPLGTMAYHDAIQNHINSTRCSSLTSCRGYDVSNDADMMDRSSFVLQSTRWALVNRRCTQGSHNLSYKIFQDFSRTPEAFSQDPVIL